MCAKKKKSAGNGLPEMKNSKAYHKYFIEESFEAGVVLQGTEVKAIRAGQVQLNDAFAKLRNDEIFLFNAHIREYTFGNFQNHEPTRTRKLLLHKKEIRKLRAAVEAGGKTLIPTKIYFKGALIKVQVSICKGKQEFDKRETIKTRMAKVEADRAMKQHIRGA